MLELLIVACLGGGECRDFPQLYDPYQVSLMTCVAAGQVEVARWSEANPEWTVRKWRCTWRDERTASRST